MNLSKTHIAVIAVVAIIVIAAAAIILTGTGGGITLTNRLLSTPTTVITL